MSQSVSFRILLLSIGINFLVMFGFGVFTYSSEQNKSLYALNSQAKITVDRIANSLVHPMDNVLNKEMETILDYELKDNNVLSILVRDTYGNLHLGKIDQKNGSKAFEPKDDIDQKAITNAYLKIKKNLKRHTQIIGSVEIFFTDKYIKDSLNELLLRILLQAFLITTVSSTFIFYGMKRIILTPISRIIKDTRIIASGNLDHQIKRRYYNELNVLKISINMMVSTLKRSFQKVNESNERLEKQVMKRTKELREANKNKSQFLANMSHEIRTPINAIIGMTDISLKYALEPRVREYVEIIHNSSHSLLNTINDILDFSKVEAGKLDFEEIRFNLVHVFDQLGDMFREKCLGKDVELVINIKKKTPTLLMGDPHRLGQIMRNLISNAIKFTESGEIVVVVDSLLKDENKVFLMINVYDTGIGIPKNKLETVFETFTQADGSTTRRYGGTGLGLSICKHLVERLNGRIWVESEEGKGSTFSFTSEFILDKGIHLESNDVPKELGNLHSVIIDNNHATRQVLIDYLESYTFNPHAFSDGNVALQYIIEKQESDNPPSLIILDRNLLDTLGPAFVSRIRKEVKSKNVVIILMTQIECDDITGIDSFAYKPVKKDALLKQIIACYTKDQINDAKVKHIKSVEEKTMDGLRGKQLLLVEDSKINQKVAKELLKQAEIEIDIANNGEEAIKLIKEKEYHAVLMDIQMPKMDGVETTKYIRNSLKRKKLPIIAMTANAMKGDRENYIAAGMNDYLSKPINTKRIFQILNKWINNIEDNSSMSFEETSKEKVYETPILDIQEAMTRLGNNQEFLYKILLDFKRDYGNTHNEIKIAMSQKDLDTVKRIVHTIKGVSGNISAKRIFSICKSIDDEFKAGRYDHIEDFIPTFNNSMQEFLTYIDSKKAEMEISKTAEFTDFTINDKKKAMKLFINLDKAIQNNNLEAVYTLGELETHVSGVSSLPTFNKLLKSLDVFEFKNASEHLNDLAKELSIDLSENINAT